MENKNEIKETEKYLKFLALTDKVSSFSKDQSTKVGAVFLNKRETAPASFGYNGMPRGLDDNHPERNIRPEKYLWAEHAERNGIYNIARGLLKDTIMFSTKFPNMEAARAVTSSGITTLVVEKLTHKEKQLLTEEDIKMNERVIQLFKETGVEVVEINREKIKAGFKAYLNNSFDGEDEKKFRIEEKYLKYLDLAKYQAENFSPDREEKTASMIFDKNTFTPIENGIGVNAPPEVISDITEEMHSKKEDWFQESEKNAVFNAVRHKFEGNTAVASWCPCIHCSLAIVSVGLSKVVTRKPDFTKEADQRWKESFDKSANLYNVANVEFVLLDVPRPEEVIAPSKPKKKM